MGTWTCRARGSGKEAWEEHAASELCQHIGYGDKFREGAQKDSSPAQGDMAPRSPCGVEPLSIQDREEQWEGS